MKICKRDGCKNPVFSHNYCKWHYKGAKEKREKYPEYIPNTESEITSQVDLFRKVWESRPHFSEISGEPLERYNGVNLLLNCFAHILPKGRFPLFKYREENIILLTPEEHHLFDFGTVEQRERTGKNWDKLYQKIEYLKVEYTKFTNNLL